VYDWQSTIHTGKEGAICDGELDRFLLQVLVLLLGLWSIGALNLWLMMRLRAEHSELTIQP
jgi:hypothetical protein